MTNQQLYLAIGIPSILILLSWLSNHYRFGTGDERAKRIENRFDAIENRFENRFDAIEHKIEGLRKEMYDEFKQFYRTLGHHDADIETLKKAGTR